MLIRMHEVSDLSVRELRDLMGDRRNKLRISDVDGLKRMPGDRAEPGVERSAGSEL